MAIRKILPWTLALVAAAVVLGFWATRPTTSQPTTETTQTPSTEVQDVAGQSEDDLAHEVEATADQEAQSFQAEAPATESNWITQGTTPLSSQLYDFIEEESVKYVDISSYPFDDFTDATLRELSQSGEVLLFDNTVTHALEGLEEKPADIVANYFGTAEEADAIVATSRLNTEGGIHYMVLPVNKNGEDDEFYADIKSAVALLNEEKEKTAGQPTDAD